MHFRPQFLSTRLLRFPRFPQFPQFPQFFGAVCLLSVLLCGCQTNWQGIQSARLAMADAIKAEGPGNYFIGRRFYKKDYKFRVVVPQPGKPENTAIFVNLS